MANFDKPRDRQRLRYTELRNAVSNLAEMVRHQQKDIETLTIALTEIKNLAADAFDLALNAQKGFYEGLTPDQQREAVNIAKMIESSLMNAERRKKPS